MSYQRIGIFFCTKIIILITDCFLSMTLIVDVPRTSFIALSHYQFVNVPNFDALKANLWTTGLLKQSEPYRSHGRVESIKKLSFR